MKLNTIRNFSLATIAILCFAIIAAAQTSPKAIPNISIENFGQMDEHYYRGAQPKSEDYKALAAFGINTIVDLRDDPVKDEKAEVEASGMKYINIPMSGYRTPRDEDMVEFLKIANDPATGNMFVHCAGGIHRTGVTGAVYRFEKYGWDYDRAYQEMKNYKFTVGLVHGALKSYVKNYARRLEAQETMSKDSASNGN